MGCDTYYDPGGCGNPGLHEVNNGRGPEFDFGELVTYLNDLALLAPSMLLVPAVSRGPVDARSFDLSLTD